MTFSRRDYFDEITDGIRRFEPEFRVFCLQASLPTIRQRLAERGGMNEWLERRIVECAAAFCAGGFGETIDTEQLAAQQVAALLRRKLGGDANG